MATPATPLHFDLPDGDSVDLCTWPYIMEQIRDFMLGVTNAIELENIALTDIDHTLDEWLSENA